MKIGNIPPPGQLLLLDKRYFCIEVRTHAPGMMPCLKPWIYFIWGKVFDHGEPHILNGRPRRERVFFREYTSPIGISIKIIK